MFHTQKHTSFPFSGPMTIHTPEASDRRSQGHPHACGQLSSPASQHRAAAAPKVTAASTALAAESSTGQARPPQ